MQQLVRVCPENGAVLDPFTGSGSTGVAALREAGTWSDASTQTASSALGATAEP